MPESTNPYTVGESALKASEFTAQVASDSPYGPATDTTTFSKIAQGMLAAQCATMLISIGFSAKSLMAYSDGSSDGLFWDGEEESTFLRVWNGLDQFDIALFVLTIIFFCIWMNKSMKNAWALPSSLSKPSFTPGWAVGYFFMPIMMLFKPFQAMREIWVRADKTYKTSPLVSSWWALWIIANIFSNINLRIISNLDEDFETQMMASIIESVLLISAAVPLIMIIRAITKRQIIQLENSVSSSLQG